MVEQKPNLQERWLPVPVDGYRELYSVSDQGRVRNDRTGYILKPWISGSGNAYLAVYLSDHGRKRAIKVHRLVALAFLPSDDGKIEVNHKNLDTHDNRLENLEWCTRKENDAHRRFWSDEADDKEHIHCDVTTCQYHTKDEPFGWCSRRERERIGCKRQPPRSILEVDAWDEGPEDQ